MFYYLTHWQMLMLSHKIEEIKKNNPYFQDTIVDDFLNTCMEEAGRIAKTPTILLKLNPRSNKIKISESMFKYITALTEINVFDKNYMKENLPAVQEEIEKQAQEALDNFHTTGSFSTNENETAKYHK